MPDSARRAIAAALDGFAPAGGRHERALAEMRAALAAPADPAGSATLPAHFTAAGIVLSAAPPARVLLILHRKLGLWLPPGGHLDPADGGNPLRAAVREVREETGVAAAPHPAAPAPFDVDAHTIPARPDMPEHRHLDIRYLLVADADAPLVRQEAETLGARWAELSDELIAGLSPDLAEPLRRAVRWASVRADLAAVVGSCSRSCDSGRREGRAGADV
jgi:8-oxo-dGTP pyrophosphatase MutT (NUDIX family)